MQLSLDTLWHGELKFWQPAKGEGYRFNLDPVLLAGFVEPASEVLELGAGSGVLSVLLLAMGKVKKITAVEIQPEMAELTEKNFKLNGFADCASVVCADLRTVQLSAAFDAVVFNPPYFAAGKGLGSPLSGRDIARHERFGTLADFFACASRFTSGNISAILRAERKQDLFKALAASHLSLLRQRLILPRVLQPANLRMVSASLEGGSLVEMPPLIVHQEVGREFTDEVKQLLREVS